MKNERNRFLFLKHNGMQKGFRIFFSFIFICIYNNPLFAQFRILNFQLSVINSSVSGQTYPNVLVEFTIAKGPSCAGYVIYHSSDSINFYPIYTFANICGDINNDQPISFLHSSPVLNSNNFYRVELTATETSPIRKIFVGEAKIKGSVYAFPNPCRENENITLQFLNINTDREFYGKVINLQGNTKYEFFGKSIGGKLLLSLSGIVRGIYAVWLTDGIEPFHVKIIVNE